MKTKVDTTLVQVRRLEREKEVASSKLRTLQDKHANLKSELDKANASIATITEEHHDLQVILQKLFLHYYILGLLSSKRSVSKSS